MAIMMKCGCAANALRRNPDGTQVPSCLIHDCIEVAEEPPDLSGRTAQCTYYGKTKPRRRHANDECNYGCRGQAHCQCGSQPSSTELAFFKHKPGNDQDEFYCGCHGWD